jgi:type I restriction enzyme S subunit
MQQLLSGKKRLPGFDGEWKQNKLGKLFAERSETKCEHLELLAITGTQGVIPRSQLDLKDNSSEDKSKYLHICVGDIGYNTMRMWQGVSAYSNYDGIVSPAYTILKPSNDINAKYFAYLFKMPDVVFLFYRFSQGLVDDTRNLKYANFKKISVTYPADKKEQNAIVAVLEKADLEIDLLRQSIEQEKQKKKALMQLLLTGIVRVNA